MAVDFSLLSGKLLLMSSNRTEASPWPAGRTRQRSHSTKREAVIRAAARAFNERGFHNTSLDDIAAALNVTKPTIYYYVTNKEELLFQCFLAGLAPPRPRSNACLAGLAPERPPSNEFLSGLAPSRPNPPPMYNGLTALLINPPPPKPVLKSLWVDGVEYSFRVMSVKARPWQQNCVYAFMRNGWPVYVGKAYSAHTRFGTEHDRRAEAIALGANELWVTEVRTTSAFDLDEAEQRMIAQFCPVLNDKIVSQVSRRLLRQARESPFAMALL